MIRSKSMVLFGTIVISFAFYHDSAAQGCCTAGFSLLGGLERDVTREGVLVLDGVYRFEDRSQGFEGSNRIDDPLHREVSIQKLGLDVEYGISKRLSLLMQAGYFEKSRSFTAQSSTDPTSAYVSFRGSGIGDLLLMGKYELISSSIVEPLQLSIGAGAKLPVGRFRQEVNGSRLPFDLQAGDGATDLVTSVFVAYSLPPIGLGFSASAFHRYPAANLDGYRYGDETVGHIGITKSVFEELGVGLTVGGRFAEKDFSNGRVLQSTGGTQFFVTASTSYTNANSVFKFFVQLPVMQNLFGIQLGMSSAMGVDVNYSFDLTQ